MVRQQARCSIPCVGMELGNAIDPTTGREMREQAFSVLVRNHTHRVDGRIMESEWSASSGDNKQRVLEKKESPQNTGTRTKPQKRQRRREEKLLIKSERKLIST